jgi:GH24 family phage-related lysozyme (muramidase)/peptidoglycan hydrolase-like protein with peptidoglycan-binding domain
MKTSAAGRAKIAQREGNKLKAYRDTKGIWTIGVGHTAAAGAPAPKAGMTITATQSDQILARDLASVEAAVNSAVKVPVTQNQFDAMVSLAFNIGNGAFKKSTVVKRLNAGDVSGAGAAFMMWNKPKEIIGRRKTEQAQFLSGGKAKPPAGIATLTTPVKATPLPAEPIADEPVKLEPAAAPAQASNKEIIATVQRRLKDLGYNPGGADGILGPLTRGSILSFKNDNKLKPVDTIDDELLTALATAKPREMVPSRANATQAQVAAVAPEVRTNVLTKIGAFFTGIFALIGSFFDGIIGNLGPASGYIQPVKDAAGDVPGWVWMLAIAGVAGGLFLVARHGANKGVEAYQNGERR